jgi:hypothetical protein
MLLIAIVLFTISAFCYSYSKDTNELALALNFTYPYRVFAIPFISTGFALMGIASVSYSRKSKNPLR